jgi:hypothetical protein
MLDLTVYNDLTWMMGGNVGDNGQPGCRCDGYSKVAAMGSGDERTMSAG